MGGFVFVFLGRKWMSWVGGRRDLLILGLDLGFVGVEGSGVSCMLVSDFGFFLLLRGFISVFLRFKFFCGFGFWFIMLRILCV